jgi:beta-glucosidase
VTLAPGESAAVTIPVPTKGLTLVSSAMRRVIEPGEFEVMVGTSSADIRLREKFTVR